MLVVQHVNQRFATRRVFESPKCDKRVWLCPDPLGEIDRSPDPLAAIGGEARLLREERDGEGSGRREGIASSLFNFWLRA